MHLESQTIKTDKSKLLKSHGLDRNEKLSE